MSLKNLRHCCAKSRFSVTGLCRQPAMQNKKRCRLHGGKSTGPKTPEGKMRAAQAAYKHGLYTNAAIAERQLVREMMKWCHDSVTT